jgi:cob(I)alamin adenosyltransferase
MKIYTKTGDDGTTGFAGGERVEKDDLRIEAVGTLDELNSAIGLALSAFSDKSPTLKPTKIKMTDKPIDLRHILVQIQNDVFTLGAELSTFTSKASERKMPETTVKPISHLESYIDSLVDKMPPQTSFILPNGNAESTALHFARTVCRRAERLLVKLNRLHTLNKNILIYVNRLSDLLFVMARYANKDAEAQQPIYNYFNK